MLFGCFAPFSKTTDGGEIQVLSIKVVPVWCQTTLDGAKCVQFGPERKKKRSKSIDAFIFPKIV